MNSENNIDTIEKKIHYMEEMIDLDSFITGDKNSKEEIASYYKTNHLAYQWFHNKKGFMHFHVSKSGTFSEEDAYYQSNIVSKYIKPGYKVLELGCGQGADITYLAGLHPDANFTGFDLMPRIPKDKPENLQIFQQDYSKLSQFEDNSIDLIYAFETIVHHTVKDPVFKEIYRVLKPEGTLIIFDYALIKKFELYTKEEQKAIALISKGGAAAMIESVEEWETYFSNNGFKIIEKDELTKELLPDLLRLERRANRVLAHPLRTKIIFKTLPKQFVGNIILGYLGYNFAKDDVGVYCEWILKKDL